jgi:tRNA threonylcarbamoyladenosine biosynthesis protein TsaE
MTSADVAGHLGDAMLELTARRKVVDKSTSDQGGHTGPPLRRCRSWFSEHGGVDLCVGPKTSHVTQTITTQSEDETAAAGRHLAANLSDGDVLLLYGDLGAGKTAFVRGLAEGLGVSRDEVSSPTFTLIQEYRGGRLPLFHVDLYRIGDPREFDELGLDEIALDGVLAIEWAEKLVARLKPSRYVEIRIQHAGDDTRVIQIDNSALPS